MAGHDEDLRDLRGRILRVFIAIMLGFGSMLGVVDLSYQIVCRYDGPDGRAGGIFDPVTMIAGITLGAIAWCFVLHWMSKRGGDRFATARVIRRRGRASRATTRARRVRSSTRSRTRAS